MIVDYCAKQLTNPNPQLFDDALWDVAKGHCSFFRASLSNQLWVCLSMLNFISSLLVIYIIMISSTRLSSIYHRIMFGISVSDVVLSIVGALGTLPMPAPGDMWTDINNFPGPRLGNVHTCAAQGFVFDLGCQGFYNGSLMVVLYYLLSIGFEIPDEIIQKYEPATYLFCACIVLLSTLPSLFNDDYNATYDFPICTSVAKPWFCREANNLGVDCVRGKAEHIPKTQKPAVLLSYITIAAIALCLIIMSVFVSDKKRSMRKQLILHETKFTMKRRGNRNRDVQNADSTNFIANPNANPRRFTEEDHFERTKTISFQALWYVAIWIAPGICWLLCLSLNRSQERPNMVLMSVLSSLGCLEGTSILLVFVFHKMHNLQVSNSSIPAKEAFWDVFTNGGVHDAIVIMEIERVTEYQSISHAPDNDEILLEENITGQTDPSMNLNFGGFSYKNGNNEGSAERSVGVSVIPGSTHSHSLMSLTASHSLEGGLSHRQQYTTNDSQPDEVEILAEEQQSSCDGFSYQHSYDCNDSSIIDEFGLFSIAEMSIASGD